MRRTGSVYIFSLTVMISLAVFAGALLVQSLSGVQISERHVDDTAALHFAEAAVDQALRNLTVNNVAALSTTVLSNGTYWAEMAPEGTLQQRVTAHGRNANEQRDLDVVIQLTPQSIFKQSLFGDSGVRIKKGAFTDSYDSRLVSQYDPDTANQKGNVGTNATGQASIEVRQGSAVNGQLVVGTGMANPLDAVSIDADVIVTADPDAVSASQNLLMVPIDTNSVTCDVGDFTTDLNVAQNTDNNFDADDGVIYCYDDIVMKKNSSISVTGNVKVYAETLTVDKNSNTNINNGGKPTQLLMYIYGSGTVNFDKEGVFSGAIFAPEATINFKKSIEIFGAIVGDYVDVDKEAKFHFDEALADITGGPTGIYKTDVISWRELK